MQLETCQASSIPVELIPIIRKRITYSLHAPSTSSVSLHSPHSLNLRYPLTGVACLTLLPKSSSLSFSPLLCSTLFLSCYCYVPPVIHFMWHLLSTAYLSNLRTTNDTASVTITPERVHQSVVSRKYTTRSLKIEG